MIAALRRLNVALDFTTLARPASLPVARSNGSSEGSHRANMPPASISSDTTIVNPLLQKASNGETRNEVNTHRQARDEALKTLRSDWDQLVRRACGS